MPTLQERLGFQASDRLLVTHADDIGMCQATVSAWRSLVEIGTLTSASTMVPCSWFPYAARTAKELGAAADLGVHLTLNCEWTDYRWSALTTSDPASGLLDAHGYLHSLARPTHQSANVDAARKELTAQIERAAAFGIDITHVDSHMLTLYHPKLMPIYLELAAQNGVPPLIADIDAEQVAQMCVIPLEEAAEVVAQYRAAAAAGKVVLVASVMGLPFNKQLEHSERLAFACDWLDSRGPGVHVLVCHPADDTPELRTIAARDFRTRVADRELLGSAALRSAIDERCFKLIGMRALREALSAD